MVRRRRLRARARRGAAILRPPPPAPPQRPGGGRHLGEGELEAPLSARPPFCGGRCQPRREAQLRTLWGSAGPFPASSPPPSAESPTCPAPRARHHCMSPANTIPSSKARHHQMPFFPAISFLSMLLLLAGFHSGGPEGPGLTRSQFPWSSADVAFSREGKCHLSIGGFRAGGSRDKPSAGTGIAIGGSNGKGSGKLPTTPGKATRRCHNQHGWFRLCHGHGWLRTSKLNLGCHGASCEVSPSLLLHRPWHHGC